MTAVAKSIQYRTLVGFWLFLVAIQPAVSAQSPRQVPAAAHKGTETGLPFVDCYTQKQYGAGAQSWVFSQDDRGVLYVGNNIGVLEFDGSSWRHIGVGGGDVVRALDRDREGRIYVGTTADFGFLQTDAIGNRQYVSLLDLVPESQRDFNDIWVIHATDDGVYLLARERLFRLREGPSGTEEPSLQSSDPREWELESWAPETRFLFSFWRDGTYYVHQGGVGLMQMAADSLRLVPGSEQFADERVQVMLPRPDGQNGFVLGSFNGGLFEYDGESFEVFVTDANDFLRASTLYKGSALSNGSYALATLEGGLVITDDSGQMLRVLDLSLGLASSTILTTFVDREGALWFSPENGICRVEIPSSLSYFDANNGLVGGAVDIIRHDGTVYAATSNGTHVLREDGRFRQIRGLARGNPQAFKFVPHGEQLLVATGTGVYRIQGETATLVKANAAGAFASTGLHRSRLVENMVFVGLTDGVGILRLDSRGNLVEEDRLPGFRYDIWVFVEPEPGTLWMGTRTDGAFRVTYTADLSLPPQIDRFAVDDGLPEGGALTFQVSGRIVAATKKGIFAFNESTQRFEIDADLTIVDFDGRQEEFWLAETSDGDVWVAAQTEAAVARKQADGSFIPEPTPILQVADIAAAYIYPEDNGVVWFGGTESMLRFDPSVGKSYAATYSALIRGVTIRDDSVVFGGHHAGADLADGLELRYKDNSMRFQYAAATYERPTETRFRTVLEGFDERWSQWTTDSRRDYTNLPFGDYVFRVRALNVYGQESQEASFGFTILPPWYRTWWAYALYALAIGLIVFGVDRVQRRRLFAKEMERAHLREAELRAESAEAEAKNVELLSRIGRDVTSRLSIEKIIDTVYENVNDLMDASVFSIGILNEAENRIEFPGSKEKGQTMPLFYYDLDDDRLATWCYHNRDEVVIQDYPAEHRKYLQADQPPVSGDSAESVLYMPLTHKDRVIGVISAQSFTKNAYSDYHINILRNLATYTAIALDNAEAYQRLNKTLEDLQAAQTRLVQSEKMASLGQLTAGIAHEIKNPLNFVNNFAAVSAELTEELVEEIDKNMDKQLAEVAEELREILSDLKINAEMINEHGKRADGIVRSMLQHSRGDSGERTATDVNALLEEYVNLAYHGMRAADPDFNSSIEKDYDEAAGEVTMVPQDIGRVLINLLNNAFYAVNERAKGAEDGYAPTVSVHTKRTTDGVEIGVRDNGTGIPDSVKAKIFEPFYTTKPTGSGTGLGLSMSYDIISKGHGGDLKVESKPGEFTQFVITLPQ